MFIQHVCDWVSIGFGMGLTAKRQIFKIGNFASALTDDECPLICRKQLPINTAVEVQCCVIMHTLDQQKLNS